jgi:hypothetical protein
LFSGSERFGEDPWTYSETVLPGLNIQTVFPGLNIQTVLPGLNMQAIFTRVPFL